MTKITTKQYIKFFEEYGKNKFPDQRLGQAFCNYFNITDSSLFYADNNKAKSLLKGYRTGQSPE